MKSGNDCVARDSSRARHTPRILKCDLQPNIFQSTVLTTHNPKIAPWFAHSTTPPTSPTQSSLPLSNGRAMCRHDDHRPQKPPNIFPHLQQSHNTRSFLAASSEVGSNRRRCKLSSQELAEVSLEWVGWCGWWGC